MASEENVPPEIDVKDFRFKQLCKIRVSASPASLPKERVNLLACSSIYGLTFAVTGQELKVLRTSDIRRLDGEHVSDRLLHVISDFPYVSNISLPGSVSGISLSCDDLTLAVIVNTTDRCSIHIYDVRSFVGQTEGPASAFLQIAVAGSQGVCVTDMAWNPVIPTLLVTCQSDGHLYTYDITDKLTIKASLPSAKAKCVCWSPKGKQLVVGSEDGSLVQYDSDLKEKKRWSYPTDKLEAGFTTHDIVWLSTYTFLVAYISLTAESSDQPKVLLVNGSKDAPPTYSDFEDVCYGTGEERERKYYFNFMQKWDMVLTGSSNASEIGIIGKHLESQSPNWEHWMLDDAARAECPLTDNHEDTYPSGIAVDYTSQQEIQLGDNISHPASPMLLVLTTEGLIIPYHMMYSHSRTPIITTPSQTLTHAGARKPPGTPTVAATPASAVGIQSASQSVFGAGLGTSSAGAFGGKGFMTSTPAPGAPGAAPFTSTSKSTLPGAQGNTVSDAKPGFSSPATQPVVGFGLPNLSSATASSGAPQTTSFSFAKATGESTAATTKPGFSFTALSGSMPTAPAAPKTSSGFSLTGAINSSGSSGASGFSFTQLGKPTSDTSQTSTAGAPSFSFATPGKTGGFGTGLATNKDQTKATTLPAAVPSASGFSLSKPASTGSSQFGVPSTGQQTSAVGFGFGPQAGNTAPSIFSQNPQSTAAVAPKASMAPTSALTGFSVKQAPVSSPAPNVKIGVPTASVQPSVAIMMKGQGSTPVAPPSGPVTLPVQPSGTVFNIGMRGQSQGHSLQGQGQTSAGPSLLPPQASAEQRLSPQPRAASPVAVSSEATISATVDNSFSKSIIDEILHFEKEMQDLRTQSARSNFHVGTKEEMLQLKKQTESMSSFNVEIKHAVKEQSKEVEDLGALTLDLFGMQEECNSREQLQKDPKYLRLLKTRALDPGSQQKLQQLQLQHQVLDQGLRDVDLILDTQWEDYQKRKKNRTNRLQTPTNDAMYRAVKSNSQLIQAQKSQLAELEERLKQLRTSNRTSVWQNDTARDYSLSQLSTLADSLLNKPPSPDLSSSQTSVGRNACATTNQLSRLRDYLYHRHVPVVRSTKPENLSMSRLVVNLDDSRPEGPAVRPPAEPTPMPNLGQGQGMPGRGGEFVGMARRSTPKPQSGPLPSTSQQIQQQQPSRKGNIPNTVEPGLNLQQGTSQSQIQGQSPRTAMAPVGNKQPVAPPAYGSQRNSNVPVFPGGKMGTTQPGTKTALFSSSFNTQKVTEINGITLEDVSPPEEDDEDEDYEDEEEEEDDEYDDEESEENGEGFGQEYNIAPATKGISTSTPVTSRLPGQQETPKVTQSQSDDTPVNRQLFGTKTSTAAGFNFNPQMPSTTKPSQPFVFNTGASSASSSFSFGSAPTTTSAATSGKPFVFTPSSKTTASSSSSFNFTSLTGTVAGTKPLPTAAAPSVTGEAGTSSEQGPKVQSISKTTSTTKTTEAASSSGPKLSGFGLSSSAGGLFGSGSTLGTTTQKSGGITGLFGRSSSTATTLTSTSSVGQPISASGSQTNLTATSSNTTTTTTAPTAGLFGGKTTTATGGLFGQATVSSTPATAPSGGFFGQASSASTGGQTTVSNTSTVAPSGGLFGQAKGAVSGSTLTGSLFGQPTSSSSTTISSSSAGLFGQTPPATTTGGFGGLLGQTTTSTSTTSSSGVGLLGKQVSTPSTVAFGPTSTSSSTGGLFGTASVSKTNTPTLFSLLDEAEPTSAETTTTTTAAATTMTATTATGLFGQSSTLSSSGGLFGSATSSSAPSTSVTTASAAVTMATGGGLFGKAASGTTPVGGLFGQTTTTTQSGGGLFGTPASTTGGTGLFGQAGSGLGSSTTSSSSTGFGFGQPSAPTFGQSGTTAFGSSGFGQPPAFGKPASGGFSQTSTSGAGGVFGSGDSGGSSGESGGGFFSGLGGKPSEDKAKQNVFGASVPSFGSTATSSSGGLFGSQTAKTFGAGLGTGGGPFSAGSSGTNVGSGQGSFSGSSGGVGATGFGVSAKPATGGFGSPPAFGGSPSFGSPPAFGSAPTFGGSPAFGAGSTGTAFGSGATFGNPVGMGGTFGSSAATSGGGFSSFASASSPSFDALAQSTDIPTFGSVGQQAGTGFGSLGQQTGAGFGSGGFSGSPAFGGTQSSPAFGGGGFGSSPSFTGYRS